jgi:peptidylprolyl isomerase
MPVSKQARSAQERQKERLAREHAARQAKKERRRRIAIIVGLVLIVAVGLSTFAIASNGSTKSTTATTTPANATAAGSAKGKPCVALKDPLPTGAPNVPVQVGPPPTTLVKKDLTEGTGAVVKPGATVTVNYVAVACSTGKIFDSSYAHGKAVQFPLDQVIPGWTNGIPGMKVGGTRLLGIPSEQAYGSSGSSGIAPDEPLWFVINVVSSP